MQIGPFGLLTILFIGLKLTDNIDWSWWLIFSPIWGLFALGLFFFVLALLFIAAHAALNKKVL